MPEGYTVVWSSEKEKAEHDRQVRPASGATGIRSACRLRI
jgi:hypothetical protein